MHNLKFVCKSLPPSAKIGYGRGFTLIELSIVLVIIGLIVGGVLVGRDLIVASTVRAQVAQIEKYQTAVNTFRDKYGYLPGDIPAVPAAQFGFQNRGGYGGEGDGNGSIEGIYYNAPSVNSGFAESAGETVLFWKDLSDAKLIDGSFTAAACCNAHNISQTQSPQYFPASKLGGNNYVYVWSNQRGDNFFGLSTITGDMTSNWQLISNPMIPVTIAYKIDSKIDDGIPGSGKVFAAYVGYSTVNSQDAAWWAGWNAGWQAMWGGSTGGVMPTTALSGSATTCFDNGGVAGIQQYSIGQNNGAGGNCGLSFQMQGGGRGCRKELYPHHACLQHLASLN